MSSSEHMVSSMSGQSPCRDVRCGRFRLTTSDTVQGLRELEPTTRELKQVMERQRAEEWSCADGRWDC